LFHNGRFYRHRGNAYFLDRAPIGARVHRLPRGFAVFQIGGRPFYYFGGVYYIYDQPQDDYEVVEQPATTQPILDVLVMTDGTSLSGHYLGGTEDTIEFEVGGETYEIDRADAVTLTLAPPPQE